MFTRKSTRQVAAKQRRNIVGDQQALPRCTACQHPYPFINELHHVKPVAATGGTSTETIWLCPNCHALVHEMIRLYIHTPKRLANQEARTYQMQWFFDEDAPELARTLFDIAKRSVE